MFLYSPSKEAVHDVHAVYWGTAIPTTSDQYLFGRMFESDVLDTRWGSLLGGKCPP